MPLTFSAATDKVDCGGGASGTAMDDLAAGTICAWVYKSSSAAGVQEKICQKGTTGEDGTYCAFSMDSDGGLAFLYFRVTTVLWVAAALANVPTYALNKWMFVAVVWDAAGANGDQILYGGDLVTPVAAVAGGSYSTQQVGSGAHTTDAGGNFTIGNKHNDDHPFQGRIAHVSMFNRVLSISDIRRIQALTRNDISYSQALLLPRTGLVLCLSLGATGTGTQYDLSESGNHGTITGATRSAPRPKTSYGRRREIEVPWIEETAAAPGTTNHLTLLGVG